LRHTCELTQSCFKTRNVAVNVLESTETYFCSTQNKNLSFSCSSLAGFVLNQIFEAKRSSVILFPSVHRSSFVIKSLLSLSLSLSLSPFSPSKNDHARSLARTLNLSHLINMVLQIYKSSSHPTSHLLFLSLPPSFPLPFSLTLVYVQPSFTRS